MACFRAWEDWAIYSSEYLINLQNLFLGLVASKDRQPSSVSVLLCWLVFNLPVIAFLFLQQFCFEVHVHSCMRFVDVY